jgi:hypothetical protein
MGPFVLAWWDTDRKPDVQAITGKLLLGEKASDTWHIHYDADKTGNMKAWNHCPNNSVYIHCKGRERGHHGLHGASANSSKS